MGLKIKYKHENGRELIKVNDRAVEFFDSSDAWAFLELMRQLFAAKPMRVQGCFPVRSLVPKNRPCKRKVYIIGASERVSEV